MKNLEQQPMSENKKSYIDNEERMAALKAKPAEDLSMEEFKALKEAKQDNEGLVDKAQEEAGVEDAERQSEKEGKIYDEAKAEDTAHEQAKAAEEKLRLAEDARVKATEDAEAAAKVLEGIQDGVKSTEQTETPKIENSKISQKDLSESKKIDAVELNNKIVRMRDEKAKAEALAKMTPEEISAVAKNIAESKWENTLDFLNNFRNKTEIIAQPEIADKLKKALSSGKVHLYDVDRILSLPGTKEIFNDPEVQKGVKESIKKFVSYQNSSEWKHVSGNIDRVVKGANISNEGLRDIAEELKGNRSTFDLFVGHFGPKRIYPQLN